MAHPLELLEDQQAILLSPAFPDLVPHVVFTGFVREILSTNLDGSVVLSSGFDVGQIDLTNSIINDVLQITTEAPVLPEGGKFNPKGDLVLKIENTRGYFAVFANGAMLQAEKIPDNLVEVWLTCGVMTPLKIYTGRMVQQPTEKKDSTTIRLTSALWELVNIPVQMEVNSAPLGIKPGLSIAAGGNLVNSPYVDAVLGISHVNGVGVFDEAGDVKTGVSNSDVSKISIAEIGWQEDSELGAPYLGKYTVEFTSATDYRVTQPGRPVSFGSIDSDYSEYFLSIPASAWRRVVASVSEETNEPVYADPTGVKIEFYGFSSFSGNPVRAALNIVYKALSNTWGFPFQEDATLPIDYAAFEEIAKFYSDAPVYVTETNKEVSVFDATSGEKPLNCRDFAQKILDHVGCQLTFTPEGKISVNSSFYIPEDDIINAVTSEVLVEHEIQSGGPKIDILEINYGLDPVTGNYSKQIRQFDQEKSRYINPKKMSLPYFKLYKSDAVAFSTARRLWSITKNLDVRLMAKMIPTWSAVAEVGDKWQVALTERPILPNTLTGLGEYWEVYKVDNRIGQPGVVMAKHIPALKQPTSICNFELCVSTL